MQKRLAACREELMSDIADVSGVAERLAARVNSSCYVCGTDNPRGFHMFFQEGDQGEMSATWTPDSTLEGFEGIVHGGVVSTVLDESMAKAVAASGVEALTAELRVRFRHHVVSGNPLRVRGWVTERNKRMVRAEATLLDEAGLELAHAWSSFLVLK
jgi:acyl-coenzyme A thioesterase PaaI-like protein